MLVKWRAAQPVSRAICLTLGLGCGLILFPAFKQFAQCRGGSVQAGLPAPAPGHSQCLLHRQEAEPCLSLACRSSVHFVLTPVVTWKLFHKPQSWTGANYATSLLHISSRSTSIYEIFKSEDFLTPTNSCWIILQSVEVLSKWISAEFTSTPLRVLPVNEVQYLLSEQQLIFSPAVKSPNRNRVVLVENL